MGEVQAVTDYNDVLTMDKDEAVKAGLCTIIGKDIDDKYIARLKEQVKHPEAIQAMGKRFKDRLYTASWYGKYPGTPDFKRAWI